MIEFDHHCIWLNNCIGVKNYRKFLLLCSSYLVHSLYTLGLAISEHYMEGSRDFRIGLSVVFMVMEALKSLSLTILLLWHAYLARLGLTTFQYLVEREQL